MECMSSKIASTFGRYEVVRASGTLIGIKLLSPRQTSRLSTLHVKIYSAHWAARLNIVIISHSN